MVNEPGVIGPKGLPLTFGKTFTRNPFWGVPEQPIPRFRVSTLLTRILGALTGENPRGKHFGLGTLPFWF